MKRLLLLVGALLTATLTYAQVGSYDTGVFPPSLPHDQTLEKAPGAQALSPGPKNSFYYWLGFHTTKGLAYSFENNKAGFTPFGQDNYWGMKISFTDSVWDVAKSFQLNHDPEGWGAFLSMQNFNLEFWPDSGNNSPIGKMVKFPDLFAGIRGYGWTFGLFSQFSRNGSETDYGPEMLGGTQALPFQFGTFDSTMANATLGTGTASLQEVPGTDSAKDPYRMYLVGYGPIGGMSAAYEIPDRLYAEVKVGSEGTASDTAHDGWAIGADFRATPLATEGFDWKVQGDAVWARGFSTLSTFGKTAVSAKSDADPAAGGLSTTLRWPLGESLWLKTGAGADVYWVPSDAVLRLSTVAAPTAPNAQSGGATQVRYAAQTALQFSDEVIVPDYWGETGLPQSPKRVSKATALGLAATYSEATDLDVALTFEEPERTVGIDPSWGSLVAFELNNLTHKSPSEPQEWRLVSHQSYLLADGTVLPYADFSLNSWGVVQTKVATQYLGMPNCVIELQYLSTNLNSSAQTPAGASVARDAGTMSLLFTFNTDS